MRSQWTQALILSPSGPLPLQTWVSRDSPFSFSEFFPEESVICQKAEWGVGEPLHLPLKWPGCLEPVLISWGVRDGRKCPGFRKLLGFFYSPNQRSRHQLLGFCAEQLDPVTEHLLNVRPQALLGRMGLWEDSGVLSSGGSALWGMQDKHTESWLIQAFHTSPGLIIVEMPRGST